MTAAVRELLRGAIDLHRHGYPELGLDQRTPLSDEMDLVRCRESGFRGVVLKSHMWPTVGRVYHLQRAVPELAVLGSITLNPVAGGFSPLAVESAAAQGARVVFMPTWGARNDIARGGFSTHVLAELFENVDLDAAAGMTAIDGAGRLLPAVRDVLGVAAENRMVVFTGHLSVDESLAIADSGLAEDRLVFSHPDSDSVGASRADIRAMAERGATIELCALGLHPRIARVTPEQFAQVLDDVSPARCVLTSDYFFEWAPPSSDSIFTLVEALLAVGVDARDIRAMVCTLPARLLGLDGTGR